jgi:hypothetical protein
MLPLMHLLIRRTHGCNVKLLARHWMEPRPDLVVPLIPDFHFLSELTNLIKCAKSPDGCRVWMPVGWCRGGQPVGETQKRPFQLSFNTALRVDFQRARVTSTVV